MNHLYVLLLQIYCKYFMQIVLSKVSMWHEFTGKTHSSSQEQCVEMITL